MSVVARFRVASIHPTGWGTAVSLHPVYSPEDVEDDATLKEIKSFYEATPNGQLTMTIRNEAAEEQFQINDEFYLRLDKIPTDQTVAAIYAKRAQEQRDAEAAS